MIHAAHQVIEPGEWVATAIGPEIVVKVGEDEKSHNWAPFPLEEQTCMRRDRKSVNCFWRNHGLRNCSRMTSEMRPTHEMSPKFWRDEIDVSAPAGVWLPIGKWNWWQFDAVTPLTHCPTGEGLMRD